MHNNKHKINAERTDQTLLAAWLDTQDQEAFEFLVERHAPMVHQVCLRQWSGNQLRAEEASQSVFIIFARKAAQIKDANKIGQWLHRCAINTVKMQHRLDARQGKGQTQAIIDEDINPTPAPEETALSPVMDEAVNSLSNALRESVFLFYYENNSVRDISQKLSISESAVKKRLHESRCKLRTWFTRAGYSASLILVSSCLEKIQAESHTAIDITQIVSCFPNHEALNETSKNPLVNGVIKQMTITKCIIFGRAALLILCFGLMFLQAADKSEPQLKTDEKTEKISDNNDENSMSEFDEMEFLDLVHPQGNKEQRSNLIKALKQKITVNFEDTSIEQAAEFIRTTTGAPITIDKSINPEEAPLITFKATNMRLPTTLKWISEITDTLIEVKNGSIFLREKNANDIGIAKLKGTILDFHAGPFSLSDFVKLFDEHLDVKIKFPQNTNLEIKNLNLEGKGIRLDQVLSFMLQSIPDGSYVFTDAKNVIFIDHVSKRSYVEFYPPRAFNYENFKRDRKVDQAIAQSLKNENITVNFENREFIDCIHFIESQTNKNFSIDPALITKQQRAINIKVKNISLHDLLEKHIVPAVNGKWTIRDQVIYIYPPEAEVHKLKDRE